MAVDFINSVAYLETLLEVKNLNIQFNNETGTINAVDNLTFKLKKGETIGIVGESGSGKSVTALSLLKLLGNNGKIASGEINFNSRSKGNIDLTKLNETEMQVIRGNEISMIFQEPMTSLNPVYTCGQQVMEAIVIHQNVTPAQAKKLTIELFEKVLLPRPEAIFNSYPHQISGGQKQRVMIAMAMSCNPSILIADEPTTALDVTVQATILELMKKLKDENDTSIIFITHDLGVVAEVADRVLVMYQGKIVEQGTVWNIFSNPKHPYTKGLLACRPRLDYRLKKLPVVADFMENDENGVLIEKKNNIFDLNGDEFQKIFVTNEEVLKRAKLLQTRFPLLIVDRLKTYFPIKKGLFKSSSEFVKAVDDVSFQLFTGETLGLVGESGCGKTTLGRSILRLVEPSDGTIFFNGKKINNLSHSQMQEFRKDMQIIFQDPYSSLNPRITIGESIIEPMKVYGIGDSEQARRKRALELLEFVNLKPLHFNRFPHEFSGGQRQRICIARAIALKPKLIICDESVSALDVSVQAQVLNLLNNLKEHFGFSFIFISHDLAVVKFMSERIIVMNKGKIEEICFADDIYENPSTEYTKRLINSIPKGEIESLRFMKFKSRLSKKI